RQPPALHSFPTRRSSDLSMVVCAFVPSMVAAALRKENRLVERQRDELEQSYLATIAALAAALDAKDRHTEAHSRETAALARAVGDRKSTRLNSSHVSISY